MTNFGDESKNMDKQATDTDAVEDHLTVDQWVKTRKEAGLKFDPQTAEVWWTYEQVLDPYGIYGDLPEECQQVGRAYFARSPDTDIWVVFSDLPDDVRDKLWEMHRSKLAFSAGLFGPSPNP